MRWRLMVAGWLCLCCVMPVVGAESVIAPGASPKKLLDQGAGEGPVWHPQQGLLFSGDGNIHQLALNGQFKVFRAGAGTNGLLFDGQGRLVACEHAARRVTRTELDGSITVLADNYGGAKFNSPNDLTLDSKGRLYFSDPRYGDRSSMEMKDARGQLVEGVYRIDPDGSLSRVLTSEVDRPNGLVITPDDKHLFVADNNNNQIGAARKLWRFTLRADGSAIPESKKLIFDWGDSRGPDGMELDSQGRLIVAGGLTKAQPPYETNARQGGVYVLSQDGKLIEFIPIPRDEVTNVAFGGADKKTLYITAGGSLWSVAMKDAGR